MSKFYFSYGTSKTFPYRNGWTTVIATDMNDAAATFKKHHPNLPGTNCLNCSFVYTAESFEKTEMFLNQDNFGAGEHEVLISDNIPLWMIVAQAVNNEPSPYPYLLGVRAAEDEAQAIAQVQIPEKFTDIKALPVK